MKQNGQALITLIVAVTVSSLILIAVTLSSISQGKNISRSVASDQVHSSAEAGLEYAAIKLIRQPACSGSESIMIGQASVDLSYIPFLGSCVVIAKAQENNIVKTVRILASYDGNQVFNVCCWLEIP